MRKLKGLTWSHPRGMQPLAGSEPLFSAVHPGISVEWRARSLRAFGDAAVETLAEQFDLLMIDHPFCGSATISGCLADLRDIVSPDLVDSMAADAVGRSAESYRLFGKVLALPTDAAAQVASYRPDLLRRMRATPPETFEETLALAASARKHEYWVALALGPTDAVCTAFSLAAGLGLALSENGESNDFDRALFADALGLLAALTRLVHPQCLNWNPIDVYETMVASDQIVYVPYAFGYSNYARPGNRRILRFTNIAGPGKNPRAGALLGGAGCAVSVACRDPAAAAAYLEFIHSEQYQRGAYFNLGGQPGRRSAWVDTRVNDLSGDFFAGTLETLENSYRRPRFPNFVSFFESLGVAINRWLREGGSSPTELVNSAEDSYYKARSRGQDMYRLVEQVL